MYTAILRVATGKPDLNFNMITTPFPVYQLMKDYEQAAGAFDFIFMTAIALALIPCVMVQFILNEREKQLKHQQLLSGMSVAGYWASNLFFDIFMAYVPILLIIMLTFVFDKSYEGIWVLFLLYPPAVVPFTYVTSFLFSSDINAQIFTLFLHFLSGGLFTIVVFVLQMIPVTMVWGDALRWVCTIFPSYCVTHGILFSASGSLIVNSRN
jgi:ATP-binding cassette subfamily A (ABC1) protein 3